MKFIFRRILVFSALVLALFALPTIVVHALAPAQSTTPPTVPPEFYPVLIGLIGYVVTQGIKSLSSLLAQVPALSWIDISGWGSAITGFLVTGALFYLNKGLGLVPAGLILGLPFLWQFLIGLFSAYGAHLTIKTIGGYNRAAARAERMGARKK